ncbi:MAG TPA: NosD domain-containing protein [Ignavibacteriaceae bacterium]|nr:NosD domain-containing protein [Ignavibacteriaceae bacterium]
MKHKTHHLYYLYYPRSWIITALLLFATTVTAQETPPTPDKFYVGTEFSNQTVDNTKFYQPFYESGMNFISQRANFDTTWQFINNYDMLASNVRYKHEYIYHYSTSYYSKWEAEVDAEADRVGFKHRDSLGNLIGNSATWKGKSCWSSLGLSGPRDSLMYGPLYRQEKRYKRWLYGCYNDTGCVTYTPRFQMALHNPGNVDDSEDVCVIKVVFRYKNLQDSLHYDTTFIERTLKVGDFDTSGNFRDFYLHPNQFLGIYEYPQEFILPRFLGQMVDAPSMLNYTDSEAYTGIQFWVDWLRTDTLCTLYIDYVEVYDNNGWNDFITQPNETAQLITEYAQNFNNQNWQNIKYWAGTDEPYTIDAYHPIRVVDSLIRLVNSNAPMMISFNPSWSWDHKINGESEITQYITRVKPQKFLLAINPCAEGWPTIRYEDHEWMRHNFQLTHSLHPNFWYAAQALGYRRMDNTWCIWRKPEPAELRSMVMLALAHGAKGIIFKWFDSYVSTEDYCGTTLKDCIVTPDTGKTELYYEIKNNLAPRLTGKLGNTIKDLNYTGNYLQYRYQIPTDNPEPVESNYLILGYGTQALDERNWHCGFFNRPVHPEDKYFMLANLITTIAKNVKVTLKPPVNTPFTNYRFRNIEGLFDTTFSAPNIFEMQVEHNAGEGYLYQFSPVIQYGGRLLDSEATQPGMILDDDMIIENGAVLTVNGVYSSKGNITIKSGGIINGSNGKIQFVEGKKLIIEGSGSIAGTSSNKLQLLFNSQQDETTGIQIKAGGSLTISNCKVEDAIIGIESLLNANYLNAQHVDFINCETHSINIAGRSPGMNPTPPPQINGCTMLNSNYGIAISNSPGMVIYDNDITNTACGIYLSSVVDAQIIGNIIISNREEYPGIWIFSSGGAIRANYITGHTNGIHFANSAMLLGSNYITGNKFHGLFIGDGSRPYMRQGQWVGSPPNMYATSGYNKIFQNGGYEGEGEDNDGSEIYFVVNSNAEMDKGCNSTYDDREPSPPLVNTELLMNCPEGSSIEVDARANYWGSWVDERRFGFLIVNYIPYLESPCPEPQDGSAGELVRMTSFGDVIDTVYAIDTEIPELTETEEAYAEAEEYFLTGNLTNALQVYEGIINSSATEEEKYLAYQRKYSIGKLTGQSTEYFNQLSNTFAALASNTQDTLNNKILSQFSTLSKVGEQEYETAITEFDNIVQQNPNTEEAVYAEIDALTTALLLEESDSTLQKGRLGKYLIKSSASYHQRVDAILRKNFGSGSKENQKELLPTEYTLYQNYPNPFNPTTTIKYDLPNTSDVSLIVFDILGRKIKELVNTKQQAGKYEVQFNASNLASGVYIYQLIAEKYMQSRKMILLK